MLKTALHLVEGADHWIERIARWCAYAAAVGIFGIVVLLAVSSIKRYVLQTPIHVTEELGGLMFMATTFLALAHGLVRNRHVRLELLWCYLPYPWRQIFEVAGYVLVLIALGLLIRETWSMTVLSYELAGRSVMTDLLLWPWRLIMPATLSLLAAAVGVRGIEIVLRLATGAPQRSDAAQAAGDTYRQ